MPGLALRQLKNGEIPWLRLQPLINGLCADRRDAEWIGNCCKIKENAGTQRHNKHSASHARPSWPACNRARARAGKQGHNEPDDQSETRPDAHGIEERQIQVQGQRRQRYDDLSRTLHARVQRWIQRQPARDAVHHACEHMLHTVRHSNVDRVARPMYGRPQRQHHANDADDCQRSNDRRPAPQDSVGCEQERNQPQPQQVLVNILRIDAYQTLAPQRVHDAGEQKVGQAGRPCINVLQR